MPKIIDYNEVLEKYKKGETDNEISESMDIDIKSVKKWRTTNGFKPNKKFNVEKLKLYHGWGWSDKEIADKLNVTYQDVQYQRQKHGLKINNVMESNIIQVDGETLSEFKIYGLEAVEKTVKSGSGHSARINIPPSWQGKKVMVVRLE